MVCVALAALYAVTRRWWLAVFPLLALSVASKYVLVLLGPVLLVWMLRRGDIARRQIAVSLALGALVGALVYVPFFAGVDTLAIVRRQAGYTTSSPAALLDAILWGRLHLSPQQSSLIMKLTVMPLFFAAYAVLLWRIPRDPGVVALMRTCFWAVFLLLVVATWWFWPWYLLFLAPLGALLPGSRTALLAGVFSASAMLMYVPYFWLLYEDGVLLQAATAGTAFVVPVLIALLPRLRQRDPITAPEGALAGD
jgi:4-amino-4-deoxy-L-arabinose transferase-like glycosyltransferase